MDHKKLRFYQELGNLISRYRKFNDLKQDDTANMISKSRTAINYMENGKHSVELYDTLTLVDKLNIPFDKIQNLYEQFKP